MYLKMMPLRLANSICSMQLFYFIIKQHQLWVYDQINYISCEITGIGTDVVSARASKSQIELYQKKINVRFLISAY